MGLHLYIATSADEAARKPSAVVFNEVIHRQIFSRPPLPDHSCPLFRRMSDPHQDASYTTAELPALVLELSPLARQAKSLIATQLNSIIAAAEEAYGRGAGLFALAD